MASMSIPGQHIAIRTAASAGFAYGSLIGVHRPLPRPQIKRNDRDGRLETVGQRPGRTEPLPRTNHRQGQLHQT